MTDSIRLTPAEVAQVEALLDAHRPTRHGLRVGPAYPWPAYRGDVIHLGNSTREQVEEIRAAMATGEFHEVVELDETGQVIEP